MSYFGTKTKKREQIMKKTVFRSLIIMLSLMMSLMAIGCDNTPQNINICATCGDDPCSCPTDNDGCTTCGDDPCSCNEVKVIAEQYRGIFTTWDDYNQTTWTNLFKEDRFIQSAMVNGKLVSGEYIAWTVGNELWRFGLSGATSGVTLKDGYFSDINTYISGRNESIYKRQQE